ncbi:MAG: ISAs1 family transposase [Ktedonobacterales bacterium]
MELSPCYPRPPSLASECLHSRTRATLAQARGWDERGRVIAERRAPAPSPAGTGVVLSQQARYYLLSARPVRAAFNVAVRTHWSSENSMCWVLDVALREDDCRVRGGHAADNFALPRRLALNLLKHEPTATRGIQGRRLKAGLAGAPATCSKSSH